MPHMPVPHDIAGTAALSICESLLLSLNDRNILPEREIVGILKDAAASHERAVKEAKNDTESALHAAVTDLLKGIIEGGNSVRRC